MPRSIFVSFVYEDKLYFDQVRDWTARGLLGPDIVVVGESADVRQGGHPAISAHLQQRIQGAAAVLVLVGENTHNHAWVQHELSFAASARKQILAARIPGTTGAAPVHFTHLTMWPLAPSSLKKAFA